MRFSSVVAIAAFATAAVAAPANVQRHVLHEKRAFSDNWIKLNRVHSDLKLPMRFGLTQNNLDKGHDLLMEVADPDSPMFGQHYTAEEVHELFAPAQESVDAVHAWLEKAGIEADRISQSANRQWIQLDLSAWEAEALLNTKYHFFEHASTGKTTIGCDSYHVHEEVKRHIDYVTPGVKLLATRNPGAGEIEKISFGWGKGGTQPPLLKAMPQSLTSILAAPALSLCRTIITPDCIQALYNFTAATTAQKGNELGIFEDLGDCYTQEDLNLFFLNLQSRMPQGTHPVLKGIGGGTAPTNLANAGAESNLDFEISYPIIWPQNSVLFQTDDPVYEASYTFAGFLNNFLDAIDGSYCSYSAYGIKGNSPVLDPPYPNPAPGGYKSQPQCGVYKPTNVTSISYGGQEPDLPAAYQQQQCNEYLKLGLQGGSIFVASGDSGVSGRPTDTDNGCINQKIFNPDFRPRARTLLPWARLSCQPLAPSKKNEEQATTGFPSGGGLSNIYKTADYQKTAVANYFKTSGPGYKYYSTSGGAIPNNGGICKL